MTKDLPSATGILWDLDNTLYRLDHVLEMTINHAVAQAAIALGADLDLEEAKRLAHESWLENRFSAHVFMKRYNFSHPEMHRMTDKYLENTVVEKCEITCNLFSKTKQKHALITHSARPWALRILDHIELRPWFPDSQVFAYEDFEYESKARSKRSFEHALAAINKDPEDVIMVEDTVDNLRIPHEMGMRTVLLHHGKRMHTTPAYVDFDFDNARDLLGLINGRP